ncbi:reticulocyte-binding protein homolog 2a-like [Saccostrea echinata]|uniref:reticulocyte-binding protein homolog 2a-like n=1 Tax=Saccostrea echinata TaxID=191078 RepID=UPI002A7EF8B1|nr:reticulocyte-binding protein homolog 2a-like [Saccostrea echinata]
MGCKHSKGAIRIQPVGPAEIRRDNSKLKKCNSDMNIEVDPSRRAGKKSAMRRTKSQKSTGSHLTASCASLDSQLSYTDSPRGQSATSKVSKHSTDSGLGEEYAHVITEFSPESDIQKIEEEFRENEGLDLGISGTAIPVRTSAKDRERMQEAMIMQALREEGLIARPQAQGASGVSFEITEDGAMMRRPPPRLEKLEKRRKKKRALTEDEIKEKLERAERRKRRKEQERLEKIKEKERTNPNDALEAFAQMQKEKEEQVNKKLDSVSDKREKMLKERQERQKERQRRAELVRQRKQMASMEANDQEDDVIPTGNQLDRS